MTAPQKNSSEDFNYYKIVQRLETTNLVIQTIPDEEWSLSCTLHKTLLVNIYSISGKIVGTKRTVTFHCGRLSEILLKLLWYGRKVQYHSHLPRPEAANISSYTRTHTRLADTIEADTMIRLREGDIVFRLIPNEYWRLTNTEFGRCIGTSFNLFYLAEEQSLSTPSSRIYKSTKLEHVLLEFLCQKSTFVDHSTKSHILEFKLRQKKNN
jgi:hypothetical protein